MTTPTQQALMALAVDLALAHTEWTTQGDDIALDRLQQARAALASAIAEVVRDAGRWRDLVSLMEYGEFCVLGRDDMQFDTAHELECAVDVDEAQATAKAWRDSLAARSAAQKTAGV